MKPILFLLTLSLLLLISPASALVDVDWSEYDNIKSTFNESGQLEIEHMIYNWHNHKYVCWQYSNTFREYNPEWSDVCMVGYLPHSACWLRRDNSSAWIYHPQGGDLYIIEYTNDGFILWNHLENGNKTLTTRNQEFCEQFRSYHFSPNNVWLGRLALLQDNSKEWFK